MLMHKKNSESRILSKLNLESGFIFAFESVLIFFGNLGITTIFLILQDVFFAASEIKNALKLVLFQVVRL